MPYLSGIGSYECNPRIHIIFLFIFCLISPISESEVQMITKDCQLLLDHIHVSSKPVLDTLCQISYYSLFLSPIILFLLVMRSTVPTLEVSFTFPRLKSVKFFADWTWDELTDPHLSIKFLFIFPPFNSTHFSPRFLAQGDLFRVHVHTPTPSSPLSVFS